MSPGARLPAHRVAVAVPCWNEGPRVPALLAALRALDPAPGVLLLLDDGSDDDTFARIDVDGVVALRHERNEGLGAGRNTLWREARKRGFPVVAFLDADVTPAPDHVRRVAGLFGDERAVAGVGGPNVEQATTRRVDAWRSRFWRQDLGEAPLLDAPMLVGANAAYRTDALHDVAGFRALFRTNGEDVDVGRRLRAAGYRLRYEPSLVVTHRREDDVGSLVRCCYRHCRDGMRATPATPGEAPEPAELVLGLARKAARAPAAALLKRRDPKEAAVGVLACGAGLVGYAVGTLRP